MRDRATGPDYQYLPCGRWTTVLRRHGLVLPEVVAVRPSRVVPSLAVGSISASLLRRMVPGLTVCAPRASSVLACGYLDARKKHAEVTHRAYGLLALCQVAHIPRCVLFARLHSSRPEGAPNDDVGTGSTSDEMGGTGGNRGSESKRQGGRR